MTDSQRIVTLIESLEGGSAKRFSEKTGISAPILSGIKAGKWALTRYIDSISAAYPDVNVAFLRGQDDYPGDISVAVVKSKYEHIVALLYAEIETQRRVINELLDKRC